MLLPKETPSMIIPSMAISNNRTILSSLLILAATALLVAIFYLPVWWVSLTAPNYPVEAFPDGVRIAFHVNGVFNGCKKVEKDEITEDEALDCVHEMDTINHYVGMYPIAAGGVVERAFSPFLFSFLAVMLLGFLFRSRRNRLLILGLGFSAIAVWMAMTWYGKDGLRLHDNGYVYALVTSMDQDTDRDSPASTQSSSGNDIIDRLRASLAASEGKSAPESADKSNKPVDSEKNANIAHLKSIFDVDQAKKSSKVRQEWTGSASQMMSWHYQKNLGRYFNNPAEITPMVKIMSIAATVVFWGLLAAMALLLFGIWKRISVLNWFLILIPMALPVFFMIEYSAWLYWYGHTLNDMGAFTVKPFMPTVFGQGKVAQFTTHSYPEIGFFLMLLVGVLLALADIIRQKQLKQIEHEA
jgi:hypothetical protein